MVCIARACWLKGVSCLYSPWSPAALTFGLDTSISIGRNSRALSFPISRRCVFVCMSARPSIHSIPLVGGEGGEVYVCMCVHLCICRLCGCSMNILVSEDATEDTPKPSRAAVVIVAAVARTARGASQTIADARVLLGGLSGVLLEPLLVLLWKAMRQRPVAPSATLHIL